MKQELAAVVEELKRLKAEGVSDVYLADGRLEELREVVGKLPAEEVAEATTQEPVANVRIETPRTAEPMPKKKAAAPEDTTPEGIAPIPGPPVVELPEGTKQEQWDWLRDRVLNSPVCNAHVRKDAGKQVVFGVGNLDADIFFCGEAPGADEEVQGEPFVGRAGQLLTKAIQAMGLERKDVYIGNIMNWRPEIPGATSGNRPPSAREMAYCLPYLKAQLAIVRPKVIVALGATAVSGLLGPDPKRRMGDVRGKWHEFAGTPLLITYHPSYILRNGSMRNKRIFWEDFMLVMEKAGMEISEKQRGFFGG